MDWIDRSDLPDPRFGLSMHIIIEAALERALRVEVIDPQAHLLRLHGPGHTALIEKSARTAIDSDMTVLLMDNKFASAKLLAEHGLRVPKRVIITCAEHGQSWCQAEDLERVVIKPKLADQGQGITFLDRHNPPELWHSAFVRAQRHGKSVMVEPWFPGDEHRFLIVGAQVIGVVRRDPPRVTGDGQRTIRSLVEQANRDPRRTDSSKTPMYPIRLDDVALQNLQRQGWTPDSIPRSGQVATLRDNSNVSTGGSAIDVTDEIHPGYHAIALRAAQALKTRLTGIDILLTRPSAPPDDENYVIIELNKEPGLYIHQYPAIGTGRAVGGAILEELGFDKPE